MKIVATVLSGLVLVLALGVNAEEAAVKAEVEKKSEEVKAKKTVTL
jgi:hypothetical protein